MDFLADTHILLWSASQPHRLSLTARRLIDDPANILYFSTVSFWEIAIKRALGRSDFQPDTHQLRRGLLDNGYKELTLSVEHTFLIETLPPIHKDIFDRMLIAQAMSEGLTLLTADKKIAQYPGPIRKV